MGRDLFVVVVVVCIEDALGGVGAVDGLGGTGFHLKVVRFCGSGALSYLCKV